MDENYFLAKWLNDELTQEELVMFMASPDFQKYEKIKNYTSQLKVADYDEDLALIKIKQSKKSNPKTIYLFNNVFFRIAAVLFFSLGIFLSYQSLAVQSEIAENGTKTSFLLPDNSEVVLNSGSEIDFKKWNWNKNRFLNLKGEAYFKVAKGRKFEVKTAIGTIAVLGTQFNVKSRGSRLEVVCYEGRVKVNYKNEQLVLLPGQSVSFESNSKITHSEIKDVKPTWISNNLISFEKASLNEIIAEIERQYNCKIELNSPNSLDFFTGKLPTNNLDLALEICATTFHLETYKEDKNKIIFE